MISANPTFNTLFIVLLIGLPAAPPAHGSPIDDATSSIESHQKRIDEQKQRNLNLERKKYLEKEISPFPSPPLEELKNQPSAHCSQISQFKVNNLNKLPWSLRHSLKKLLSKRVPTCLGMEEIRAIVSDLNSSLFNKGFITSRAHLVEQDTSDGVLIIHITLGYLEDYHLSGLSSWQTFLLFNKGVLNFHRLSYGLDQLKRLRSNNPSLNILPGSKKGQSLVRIDNQASKHWFLQLSHRAEYQKNLTAQHNTSLNLDLENLLHSNDLISISANSNPNDRGEHQNAQKQVKFQLPIRRLQISTSRSTNDFNQKIHASNTRFETLGESREDTLKASFLIKRSQTINIKLDHSLSYKTDENTISDANIDVQSGSRKESSIGIHSKLFINKDLKTITAFDKYYGFYKGYDINPNEEEKMSFKRNTASILVQYQLPKLNISLEAKQQRSSSVLIGGERFSAYSSYIPGSIYLPNTQGRLISIKLSTPFYKKLGYHSLSSRYTKSELGKSIEESISGLSFEYQYAWKSLKTNIEIGKETQSPTRHKNWAGNLSINWSI